MNTKISFPYKVVSIVLTISILLIIVITPSWLRSDYTSILDLTISFILIINVIIIVRIKSWTKLLSIFSLLVLSLSLLYSLTTIEHIDEPEDYYLSRITYLLDLNFDLRNWINLLGISNLIAAVLLIIFEICFCYILIKNRRSLKEGF